MGELGPRQPYYRRIGFRVALGVTASFFIGSIVLTPIWESIAKSFHPIPGQMPTWLNGWTPGELFVTGVAILAIGAALGGILGWIT